MTSKTNPPSDPSDNVVPIRSAKGTFVKGVSGNPTGRPSAPTVARQKRADADAKAVYKRKGAQVANILWKIIANEHTAPTARIAAIKEWNDRGFGKPAQAIEVSQGEPQSNINAEALSSETLADILAASKVARTGIK